MKVSSFSFVRLLMLTVIFALVVSPFSSAVLAASDQDRPWMNTSLSAEQRTQLLLNVMTLEDKVEFITGDNIPEAAAFYNKGLDKYGIPELRLADATLGIRIQNPNLRGRQVTNMPATIGLAATWNPAIAKEYGDVMGNEAFNTTHNGMLGPAVDIARTPIGARNFEGLGEDPLLAGVLGENYTKGIQSYPVMATAKHFVANNQELNRFEYNVEVSNRALNEIYARPYTNLINNADVASVMCSFNKLNSVFACENGDLMNKLLRDNLGFKGFVQSDYYASKTTAGSINAGLDIEMPGAPWGHWGNQLVEAVKNGEVTEARVNEAAYRILYQMFDKGLFDHPVQNNEIDTVAHRAVSREIAAQSMVLLQNKDNVLPFKTDKIKSIAVIGPDADNTSAQGGGSSIVLASNGVSPLEGIKNRAGRDIKVEYLPGTDPIGAGDLVPGPEPVPSAFLSPSADSNEQGLKAVYWDNDRMEGNPVHENVVKQPNLQLGFYNYDGLNANSPKIGKLPWNVTSNNSIRYTGVIHVPKTGDYTLSTTSLGSSKVYIDGNLVIDNAGQTLNTVEKTVTLEAGKEYPIQIDFKSDYPMETGPGRDKESKLRFGWKPADDVVDSNIAAAVELAKKSDVAVIVTRDYQSEGTIDRADMKLPNNQSQLIREVAKANKNVVVVNETGNPVEMNWKDDVAGIIQAWYPGDEQGNAIADVLFGDVNPSGKLPVTFPVNVNETPTSFDGAYGFDESKYLEGVFVGYRGYEKNGIQPAYSFGHGLSYTSFDYKNLKAKVSSTKNSDEPAFEVTLNLRNTGKVKGSEVVQVYAGKLPTEVDTAPKQLAGFQKVELEPGKQTKVTIKLDPKSFSYFDEATNKWVMPSGEVPIYVGSSSTDIRLEGSITVSGDISKNFNEVSNAK
ncbi:beta-glucosidase [Paenibacillus sp. LPE1-1-1.1]|uniref:beta-glucosidase n=1 Tax=Paenibacillus sp. LPE1-1-1.1 TaxID=3135230 RepID=UPI003425C989